MKRLSLVLLWIVLVSCTGIAGVSKSNDSEEQRYSSAAITLPDFSMKIVPYYRSQKLPVPNDFDARQFFVLLKRIYPDQDRVTSIEDNYRVSVRPVGDGYSVMLCDPATDRKIMEDFSCHVSHVELRSWENAAAVPCVFESDWKPLCE